MLQLLENELRDDEGSFHKSRITDIRDTPVDDHTGIQNFVTVSIPDGLFGEPGKAGRFEFFSFFQAQEQTQVAEGAVDQDIGRKIGFPTLRRAQ